MLWNRNFISVCGSNFLMYIAFYMLLPILPIYLGEELKADASLTGAILALYTVAALFTRPVAGFWLDRRPRKPLLLLFYLAFISICLGYILASTIALFFVIRFAHGIAFGSSTVGVNTMAVDVIPEERRAEGIGIFSASTSAAMAVGPLISLFLYESGVSFDKIFACVFLSGAAGFCITGAIRAPRRTEFSAKPFSPGNLLLKNGIPEASIMALLAFGYGIVTVYLSVYAKEEVGIETGVGYYFTLLSIGLVSSRLMSAMLLRSGRFIRIFAIGIICLLASFFIIAFVHIPAAFFLSALTMGAGYGLISPTAQTMIINMAKNTDRGKANATYLTFFDIGVGSGVFIGGIIAQYFTYSAAYAFSLVLVVFALFYLRFYISGHFGKYRLR